MVRACLVLFLTPLPSGCDHVPKELYRITRWDSRQER
jgi:hypothetical protein